MLPPVAGTSVVLMLALGATAHADRSATGPVHNPHLVQTHHLTFVLPANNWAHAFGALSGAPDHGGYLFAPGSSAPRGATGNLRIDVNGRVRVARPVARGNRVVIKPGGPVLRVLQHGTHGPVTWWSGTVGARPEAVGYQRAPKSLDPSGKRWLVYDASTELNESSVFANRQLRLQAQRSVLSIARTLRLQPGPDPAAGLVTLSQ
jgi:hypothetical protein